MSKEHSSEDCGYPSLTSTWCGKCVDRHRNKITPPQSNWEKEFRRRFWEEYTSNDRANLSWESLKSFISTLLQQEREELVGEIEKMKINDSESALGDFKDEILSQVLNLIKKQ